MTHVISGVWINRGGKWTNKMKNDYPVVIGADNKTVPHMGVDLKELPLNSIITVKQFRRDFELE